MNVLVFHIVSGQAFFTGITLILIAAAASTQPAAIWRRITILAFLIGAIAVAVSSTPIPYWYYAFASLVTLTWIATSYFVKWRHWTAGAVAVAWLGAALIELPYHVTPSLKPTTERSLAVIGDSVTAGHGDESFPCWPEILQQEHHLRVQDISHVGETAGSALTRAQQADITAPLIVIEIGGNDILGSTTPADFARNLDDLLAHLSAPGRQLLMFELPLPPFYHEYGRIQRTTAARHHVQLVPKRTFLSILAGSNATVDSIHLSQSGQQQMAECVWQLVRGAFETTPAT